MKINNLQHKPIIIITLYLLFISISKAQQIPTTLPSPQQVVSPQLFPGNLNTNNNPHIINNADRIKKQLSQYENDKKEFESIEARKKEIQKELNKNNTYKFPSFAYNKRTHSYYKAFDILRNMNPDNFSIKEATFLIENAFYNNTKNYTQFNQTITDIGNFIKKAMLNENIVDSKVSRNMMIYRFITDTLTTKDQTHLPYSYDFNDYLGRKNWDNMFVSKLMVSGSGQCNSLPRLYQILSEELNTEAKLTLSPNHSFIRIKSGANKWHNIELTSGAIVSDNLMIQSGFIKTEAILSKNYLTGQTKRQVMSQLLNDLASGYISKFGYDDFVEQIINKSLELNPNGINNRLHKANYKINLYRYTISQLKITIPQQIQQHPKLVKLIQEIDQLDKELKDLGYEPIKQEDYQNWIEQMKQAKKEQNKQKLLNQFKIKKKTITN